MSVFSSEIISGFAKYLVEKGKISEEEILQQYQMADEISVFMYSDCFKDFLVEENYADSDIYTKSITDIEEMDFVNGKFVSNEEEEQDNINTSQNKTFEMGIDNIDEGYNEIPEFNAISETLFPFTSDDNFELPVITDEQQTEEPITKIYSSPDELLEDMYKDEAVLQYLDWDNDFVLSDEEKLNFENYIQGDDEEISLEKLQEAYESIKDNSFDFCKFLDFVLESKEIDLETEDVEEVNEPEKIEEETSNQTNNVSANGGSSGGSYSGSSNSVTSKPKEKTLDEMNEAELNTEREKANSVLTDNQSKLSSLVNGSDKNISGLQENVNTAYETLQNALKETAPDLSRDLDDVVTRIAEQEQKIGQKEIEVIQQEAAESAAKTALSNAISTRDSIKESLETLKWQQGDPKLSDEQKSILADKISAAENKLAQAEDAIRAAEQDLKTQQDTLETMKEELSDLKGEEGLEKLKQEKSKIDIRVSAVNTEIAGFNDDYNAKKAKLDEQKTQGIAKVRTDILDAQKYVNKIDTAINNLKNKNTQKELKFSKTGDIFDNDIDISSEYVEHDGVMPYLVVGPEDPDPNVDYPVLVYLHGAGEFGNSEDKLRNASMQYVLINGELRNGQDVDLAKFNGYVIFPQASKTNWTDPAKANEIVKVLDDFSSTHNIDMDHIALSGHSMGGTGAQYIAHEFEVNEYGYKFSKVAVISGYEVAKARIDELQTPMRGYVGTSDSDYMHIYFRSVVGDSNLFVVNSEHGSVPEYSYILDENHNGISDMFEWLFSDD